jgi:flagellar motor switch protein FliN/FliY
MSDTEIPEAAETQSPPDLEEAIDRAAEAVAVQTRELEEIAPGDPAEPMGLASLMDVPVQVTVEVGRARLTIAELVELGHGSLVELDRAAHEPADILVNGKVVARGEIVTIGESYGVRITRVNSE